MIRFLSGKIAAYVVKHDEEADYDVVAYGYETLLHDVLTTALMVIAAIPFGIFFQVAAALLAYHLLRNYCGGAHAKSSIVCTVTSIILLYGMPFLVVRTALKLPIPLIAVLLAVNLLLLWRYAPADTEEMPIRREDVRRQLRIKSMLCAVLLFIAAVALWWVWPSVSASIALSATVASLMTHPVVYFLYRCKKSVPELAAE
ncbi:accessory gene regulator B family protein [Ruminococcaceae bacterium OttesenSCG-928-L11]|nr:accessory gene regulator B family protein [Ruminococcaceae bacterium OttesenSCG-928-L11]